ncbi:unnamed protein product [Gadus morhua 'NCC']
MSGEEGLIFHSETEREIKDNRSSGAVVTELHDRQLQRSGSGLETLIKSSLSAAAANNEAWRRTAGLGSSGPGLDYGNHLYPRPAGGSDFNPGQALTGVTVSIDLSRELNGRLVANKKHRNNPLRPYPPHLHQSPNSILLRRQVASAGLASLCASLLVSMEASLMVSMEASLLVSMEASLLVSMEASLMVSMEASLLVSMEASLLVSMEANLLDKRVFVPCALIGSSVAPPTQPARRRFLWGPGIVSTGVEEKLTRGYSIAARVPGPLLLRGPPALEALCSGSRLKAWLSGFDTRAYLIKAGEPASPTGAPLGSGAEIRNAEDQGGKDCLRAGRTSGPCSCDICHSADAFLSRGSSWSLMSRGRGAEEPLMFISCVVNGRQSPEHRGIPNAGSPPQPPSSGAPAGAMAPGGRPRFSCNLRRLESN